MTKKQNVQVVETYDRIATVYDRKFESYLKGTFKVAVETLALKGNEHILDIACGTGELERLLLKSFPNLHIIGIDITKSMLSIAHKKCKGLPNLHFLHMPSQDLKFNDNTFDVVITCSAFHYMREPAKVLAECQRVLKPDGRFILIDWCRDFLWAKFYDWLFKIYKKSHYKVYTLRELQLLLLEAVLTIEKTKTFSIPPFWRMMCVEAKKEPHGGWSSAVGG
jgi:ubiquinone/menaquinone biosynthesis C-methylase UbiE